MTRGRPGTRQQRETYDISIGIPSTPEAKFLAAREAMEMAFWHPMRDGVIQAFADVAAEQFRQMQIDGMEFTPESEYRFGKG